MDNNSINWVGNKVVDSNADKPLKPIAPANRMLSGDAAKRKPQTAPKGTVSGIPMPAVTEKAPARSPMPLAPAYNVPNRAMPAAADNVPQGAMPSSAGIAPLMARPHADENRDKAKMPAAENTRLNAMPHSAANPMPQRAMPYAQENDMYMRGMPAMPSAADYAMPRGFDFAAASGEGPFIRAEVGGRGTDTAGTDRAMADMTMQGPPLITERGYIPWYLTQNIGKNVRAEFIIGSEQYQDKVGRLIEVGINYFVLEDVNSRTHVMCDLYSVKFVTVLQD